jgi:hypothetical protein
MLTPGKKVVRGRWGRSASARSCPKSLTADDVAVLVCCMASALSGGAASSEPRGVPARCIAQRLRSSRRGDVRGAADYSADMTVWQYAQLTVIVERRPTQGDKRTVLWHGPGPGGSEDYSQSGQTALELLNRFGADGWVLAGIQDYDDGAAESSHWDGRRLLTIYTFRRLHTPTGTKGADRIQEEKGSLQSQQARTGRGAHPKDGNLAEVDLAGSATLISFTVSWLWDSGPEASGVDGRSLGLATGGLAIERKIVRLPSQADIGEIEASFIEYEDPKTSQDRREEIKKAAADYAASWMEGQWGDTWWKTSSSFPFSEAANVLNSSADWLRSLVENPLADVASAAGAEGPAVSIATNIITRFVAEPVTAPLEAAARICEVAGIVIFTAVGAHPLAMACVKLLAHDELNDVLAKGFEQIPDAIEQILHSIDIDRKPAAAEAKRSAADARQLARLERLGMIARAAPAVSKDDPGDTPRQAPAPSQAPRPAHSEPARPYSMPPPRPDPKPRQTLDPPGHQGLEPPSPGQALPPPGHRRPRRPRLT